MKYPIYLRVSGMRDECRNNLSTVGSFFLRITSVSLTGTVWDTRNAVGLPAVLPRLVLRGRSSAAVVFIEETTTALS